MNFELINRILTSLILLPVLIYSSYYAGFYLIIFLILVYCLSIYEIVKNTKNLLFNISSNVAIFFALFSFYYLRGDTNYSLVIIYWILLSTFLSDIGGYVFGKTFKGKKLTKISPNKTYSGSIGSVIFSIVSLPSLSIAQNLFFNDEIVNFYSFKYFFLTVLMELLTENREITYPPM